MKKQSTKEKILKTAARIFSDKGYKETTIRMIAEAAKVNVAAVNYHYGDKEKLYLEVIRYWAEDAFADFPEELISGDTLSPEEYIRLFILHTLFCLLGKNGKGTGFGRLLAMEAAISPSSVVGEVLADTIGKPTENLKKAVAELTKENDPVTLKTFTACIVGQTVYFYLSRHLITLLFGMESPECEADIRVLAENIYRFAMRGIR